MCLKMGPPRAGTNIWREDMNFYDASMSYLVSWCMVEVSGRISLKMGHYKFECWSRNKRFFLEIKLRCSQLFKFNI